MHVGSRSISFRINDSSTLAVDHFLVMKTSYCLHVVHQYEWSESELVIVANPVPKRSCAFRHSNAAKCATPHRVPQHVSCRKMCPNGSAKGAICFPIGAQLVMPNYWCHPYLNASSRLNKILKDQPLFMKRRILDTNKTQL
jgi:hypothetical protein